MMVPIEEETKSAVTNSEDGDESEKKHKKK